MRLPIIHNWIDSKLTRDGAKYKLIGLGMSEEQAKETINAALLMCQGSGRSHRDQVISLVPRLVASGLDGLEMTEAIIGIGAIQAHTGLGVSGAGLSVARIAAQGRMTPADAHHLMRCGVPPHVVIPGGLGLDDVTRGEVTYEQFIANLQPGSKAKKP